ncbi:MAG TPA: hypothetical protein VEU33_26355 [Archangium sp.]|nr:hypothetical protein [Archangium sp.]
MRPIDLSEFSYGYAITEQIIQQVPTSINAAPIFPSLIAEGQPGGGYDIKLSFNGFLLFLLFKISDMMERKSAIESAHRSLTPPFYRMHLRSSAKSNQHAMLLALENSGEEVYYAAPEFHTAEELDNIYLSKSVIQNSRFIKPSQIGPLPDNYEHWVSFKPQTRKLYFCSTPPRLLDSTALRGFEFLKHIVSSAHTRKVTPEILTSLASRMRQIAIDHAWGRLKEMEPSPKPTKPPIASPEAEMPVTEKTIAPPEIINRRSLDYRGMRRPPTHRNEAEARAMRLESNLKKLQQQKTPQEQISYLARSFFGCEVIKVQAND